MLKLFAVIRKASGFTHEDFINYWVNEHAEQGRKLPGLRKYLIHDICTEVGADEPRWDCLIEMWFESKEAYENAYKSAEWKSAETDLHTNDERIICLSDAEFAIVTPGKDLVN